MTKQKNWKDFWERNAEQDLSNVEFDRGVSSRDVGLDLLAREELLEFIDPQSSETVLDAGCGTGTNLELLSGKVRHIVATDYSVGAMHRCSRRAEEMGASNVSLFCSAVTHLPIRSQSVDRIICMSVLQYVDDDDAHRALGEFARVLRADGELILHVKNLASMYLSSLRAAKRLKAVLGRPPKMEYVRTFSWYVTLLRSCGFETVAYNSFNLLVVEGMPRRLLAKIQRMELEHRNGRFFGNRIARQLGADLKLKARLLR